MDMMNEAVFCILMLIICHVTSDFRCPTLEKTTLCACSEMVWWDNENRTVVDCSSANLHSIPNLEYLSSTKITKLLLSGNNISNVSLQDFKNINVRELDLSRNSLSNLAKENIQHLSNVLTHLNLKSNKIELDRGLTFLENFEVLSELNLDSNFVGTAFNDSTILPNNIFKNLGLISLKTLSLRSCGLNSVQSKAFVGLQSLETLDLTYNYLEEVPIAVKFLPNLRKLILSGNSIYSISSHAFVNTQLDEIVLDYNEISTIDVAAFSGVSHTLRKLGLHSNYLAIVPTAAFSNLKNMTSLKLSKNNIQRISKDAFAGLRNLRMLELDWNKLQYDECKGCFASLSQSLDTLLLRETGLKRLPINELLTLKKLQTLDVSFNSIGPVLDEPIGQLKSLKTLILTNNNITSINPRTFKNLTRPMELDLDYNMISDVTFVLQTRACSFSYVDVIGNPLPCNCDLEFILNSGIMHGIGLTGHCKTIHGRQYELGSSSLTRTLDKHCNRTERVYWCSEFFVPINTSARVNNHYRLVVLFLFVIEIIFNKCL